MQRESSGALYSYFNNGESAQQSGSRPTRPQLAAGHQASRMADTNRQQQQQQVVEGRDPVSQDKIWRQFLDNESRLDKQWEQNWGFLTEYDPKGNKKEKKVLAEESTVFSEKVPNTDAGNYGNRLATNSGQRIAQMQKQFETGNRRSKPDKDIVCY